MSLRVFMKKIIVGFLTIGAFLSGLYALGYFRHFLEEKFNDGIQYGMLNHIETEFSSRFQKPIDYSVSGTLVAGFMGMIFLLIVCVFVFFIFYMAYRIGDDILSPEIEKNIDDSEEDSK